MTPSFGSLPATGNFEFPCTNCGRTLKVATSAAGKRASCPQCNAIVQVPQAANGPGQLASTAGSPAGLQVPPQPAGQPIPLQFAPQQATTLQSMGHPPGQPPASQQPSFQQPGFQQPGFGQPTYQPPPQPAFKPQPPPPLAPAPQLAPQIAPGHETPTKQLFDKITSEIA